MNNNDNQKGRVIIKKYNIYPLILNKWSWDHINKTSSSLLFLSSFIKTQVLVLLIRENLVIYERLSKMLSEVSREKIRILILHHIIWYIFYYFPFVHIVGYFPLLLVFSVKHCYWTSDLYIWPIHSFLNVNEKVLLGWFIILHYFSYYGISVISSSSSQLNFSIQTHSSWFSPSYSFNHQEYNNNTLQVDHIKHDPSLFSKDPTLIPTNAYYLHHCYSSHEWQ